MFQSPVVMIICKVFSTVTRCYYNFILAIVTRLKFFKRTDESIRYKGARAIDDLLTFVKKEIGLIKEPEEPAVEVGIV